MHRDIGSRLNAGYDMRTLYHPLYPRCIAPPTAAGCTQAICKGIKEGGRDSKNMLRAKLMRWCREQLKLSLEDYSKVDPETILMPDQMKREEIQAFLRERCGHASMISCVSSKLHNS
jgi:hypothetical protein